MVGATTGSPQTIEQPWEVPVGAVGAWLVLRAAVRSVHDVGRAVPCEADPRRWWTERPSTSAGLADTAAAVQGCRWCPVRRPCLVYALAAGETGGVWGGLTPAQRRAELAS